MSWKSFIGGFLFGLLVLWVGQAAGGYLSPQNNALIAPLLPSPTPKPLLKYSFPNLKSYVPEKSRITLERVMFEEEGLTAYLAKFQTGGKTMSLQVMVPKTTPPAGGFPIILMNRGFVDAAIYQTGLGTKNGARYFAEAGFITVAPDFLGYGESDPPPVDTIEARLERPRQDLDLLASLNSLPNGNPAKVGIWGHSNGGQISVSLLEITGQAYPTVLWAPVTKPFPYSVLYFTDDSPDEGKALRQVVSAFEKDYDVFDFSIGRSMDRITAPMQLHQGTADTAVPVAWSTAFTEKAEKNGIKVDYYIYPGTDHNMQPDWSTVAGRSLAFFRKHLYGE